MWISVNERLPKEGQMIVTYSGYWHIEKYPNRIARMMNKNPAKWFEDEGVTHWIELPDPPSTEDPRTESKREGVEL